MKKLFVFASVFFMGLLISSMSSTQGADKEYAPLVEKDTKVLARVDMTKFELADINKHAQNIASFFVDSLVKDEKERKQSKEFMPAMIGMVTAQYAPLLDSLKKNGVDHFYVVGNSQEPDLCPCYVAIPVGNKTKEQQKEIRSSYKTLNDAIQNLNFSFPFVRHGFIFMPMFSKDNTDDAQLKSFIQKRFKDLASAPNKIIEDGIENNLDSTVTIVSLFDEAALKKTLENIDSMKEMSASTEDPVVKTIVDNLPEMTTKLSKATEYSVYNINLKKPSFNITLKLKSSEDAKNVVNFIPDFAKKIGDAVTKSYGKEAGSTTSKLITALVVPEAKDTGIIWNFDADFFKKNDAAIQDGLKFIQKLQEEEAKKQEGQASPLNDTSSSKPANKDAQKQQEEK